MIGQNAIPLEEQDSGFTGKPANKKIWLFVSRARDHVTEEIVEQYLKNKINEPNTKVEIKELPTKNTTKDSKCFMVGLDYSLKEVAYTPDFWPKEINVSRFNFIRGRHFLEVPTHAKMPLKPQN